MKKVVFLFLIISSSQITHAQGTDEVAPAAIERLFFGGNFGLQFGTITDIEVSPIVGYWVLPRIAVALGPQYRFYKVNDSKTNIIGGKAYTEFYLFQNLNDYLPIGANVGVFLHLEDEILMYNNIQNEINDQLLNTVLFGGGISQPLGIRSSANIVALWAIGGNGYDYYGNPEIRIIFTF